MASKSRQSDKAIPAAPASAGATREQPHSPRRQPILLGVLALLFFGWVIYLICLALGWLGSLPPAQPS